MQPSLVCLFTLATVFVCWWGESEQREQIGKRMSNGYEIKGAELDKVRYLVSVKVMNYQTKLKPLKEYNRMGVIVNSRVIVTTAVNIGRSTKKILMYDHFPTKDFFWAYNWIPHSKFKEREYSYGYSHNIALILVHKVPPHYSPAISCKDASDTRDLAILTFGFNRYDAAITKRGGVDKADDRRDCGGIMGEYDKGEAFCAKGEMGVAAEPTDFGTAVAHRGNECLYGILTYAEKTNHVVAKVVMYMGWIMNVVNEEDKKKRN